MNFENLQKLEYVKIQQAIGTEQMQFLPTLSIVKHSAGKNHVKNCCLSVRFS